MFFFLFFFPSGAASTSSTTGALSSFVLSLLVTTVSTASYTTTNSSNSNITSCQPFVAAGNLSTPSRRRLGGVRNHSFPTTTRTADGEGGATDAAAAQHSII